MILCESRRRQRRNGVHAENEQEYLQKLAKEDQSRQMSLEHQQPFQQLEGFIINQDFSFDPFHPEPIILLEKITIYKSHFLLLICEDFSMNIKRLQSILDSSEMLDNLTESTTEEQTYSGQLVFKQDCYVHTLTFGNIIHKFHIWILNHLNPLEIFRELYYPLFNAFIIVTNEGHSSKQNLFQAEFTRMRSFNQAVKCHTISDSDDVQTKLQYLDKQSTNFENVHLKYHLSTVIINFIKVIIGKIKQFIKHIKIFMIHFLLFMTCKIIHHNGMIRQFILLIRANQSILQKSINFVSHLSKILYNCIFII